MQDKNNIYIIKYIVLTLLACASIIACSFFYKKSKEDNISSVLEYVESNNIDYKVNLKDNTFFDKKYLTKEDIENDKAIITNLISNININYNYKINFNDYANGEYTYYIKGIVESNEKDGSKNYWSKEYMLTDKKNIEIVNSKSININDEVKVNYSEYNNILNEWKKASNVSMDGKLRIILVFEGKIGSSKLESKYKIESNNEIYMNLGEESTTIKIVNSGNHKKIVENKISDDTIFLKYKMGVIVTFISAIIFVILIIITRNSQRDENKFKNELKRILSEYDNIIVNVYPIVDTKNLNIIRVKSFDELLDAYNEIKEPINFFMKKHSAVFMIIHNDMAWMYTLMNYDD